MLLVPCAWSWRPVCAICVSASPLPHRVRLVRRTSCLRRACGYAPSYLVSIVEKALKFRLMVRRSPCAADVGERIEGVVKSARPWECTCADVVDRPEYVLGILDTLPLRGLALPLVQT